MGTSGKKWSVIYAGTGTINTSDERLKTQIKPSDLGLEFINKLNPISYKWINGGNKIVKDANGEDLKDEQGYVITEPTPGKRIHYGLLAQQLKSVLNEVGNEDFAGWVLSNVDDPDSEQAIRYSELIAPLIKAVQELSTEVKTLKSELAAIKYDDGK